MTEIQKTTNDINTLKPAETKHSKDEEEYKIDFSLQISPDPKINLSPKSSIFGSSEYQTIEIQEIYISNKEYDPKAKNHYKHQSPFEKLLPFITFENIITDDIYSGPSNNAFFDSFFLAYISHGEIVLSPDDIWLQISSCFGQYVNNNAEKLRKKLVSFDSKMDLAVIYNETNPSFQDIRSKSFRWDAIMEGFSLMINKHTLENIADLVECNFSTTGPIAKIASQIALMNSCQKYFNYRMAGKGCGIQKVHFLGTEEDWQKLKEKVKELYKYSLQGEEQYTQWLVRLEFVIDNLINTYQGLVDVDFWNQICEQFRGYELKVGFYGRRFYEKSQFINGWILDFFLFDNKNQYMSDILIDHPFEIPDPHSFEIKKGNKIQNIKSEKGINLNSLPNGIWKAPVVIEFLNRKESDQKEGVNFLAGFTGVLNEGIIYRPQTSFGVSERNLNDDEKNLKPLGKLMKRKFK